MAKLLILKSEDLKGILKGKFPGTELVQFPNEDEIDPELGDSLCARLEGVYDGEDFEEMLDHLEFSTSIEEYIISLGFIVIGVRYFSISEGVGVTAIIR